MVFLLGSKLHVTKECLVTPQSLLKNSFKINENLE